MRSKLIVTSMVVIALALSIASAHAGTVSPEATGKDLGIAIMSAHVLPDGKLNDTGNSGVVSTKRVADGAQEVVFNRHLEECAAIATIQGTNGFASTSFLYDTDIKAIGYTVRTFDLTSQQVDLGFSMIVFCPR